MQLMICCYVIKWVYGNGVLFVIEGKIIYVFKILCVVLCFGGGFSEVWVGFDLNLNVI